MTSCVDPQVKRLGGGFGGKESRTVPFSAAIAIAAQHLERPVRINVERDMDMLMTGQRHAFRVAYVRIAVGCFLGLAVHNSPVPTLQVQGGIHRRGCRHWRPRAAVLQRRPLARPQPGRIGPRHVPHRERVRLQVD